MISGVKLSAEVAKKNDSLALAVNNNQSFFIA
jgi:hypothetical protein